LKPALFHDAQFIIVLAITTLFTALWSASPVLLSNCFANACYGR